MWWERVQLKTQYNTDKKEMFYLKPTILDETFMGSTEKNDKKIL